MLMTIDMHAWSAMVLHILICWVPIKWAERKKKIHVFYLTYKIHVVPKKTKLKTVSKKVKNSRPGTHLVNSIPTNPTTITAATSPRVPQP